MAIDSRNYDPALSGLGVGIRAGSGVPTESAPKGTIYIDLTAAGANLRMYINTNGSTGWGAVTSA